jgi:hypothetical protein
MSGRPQIPPEIVDKLMFLSGHRCCLEREPYNPNDPLDIHHLDGNRENNDLYNLMPLCKNCHLGRVHVKGSFARQYTISELRQIMDDWYNKVEEKRNEDAKSAVNESKAIEDEQKLSSGLQFNDYFNNSEINFSKKSHIIFHFSNKTDHIVKLLSYQFEIYYNFINKLIPHMSYSKHYWDLNPSELGSFDSKNFSFDEVDPSKSYLLSDEKGEWIARVYIEYTYNKKIINIIYSDAIIRIT